MMTPLCFVSIYPIFVTLPLFAALTLYPSPEKTHVSSLNFEVLAVAAHKGKINVKTKVQCTKRLHFIFICLKYLPVAPDIS